MEKENTGVIDVFTTNKNGVRIKQCCASCQTHAPYDSEGPRRLCTIAKRKKIVKKNDLCSAWTMIEMMSKVKINGCSK